MAEPLDLPADLRDRIQDIGHEFLAGILEIEVRRRPANIEALAELGHVYTLLGRYEEGLAVDGRLAFLAPDNPTVQYNLACSHALLGAKDEALDALEHAIELGYDDAGFLLADEDLRGLRDEPRFRELAARIAARAR